MSHQHVRVFIVDDHPDHRDGVARAISQRPGLELVGVAEEGPGALAAIRELSPDVAVLTGLAGVELAEEIAREGLDVQVVLLVEGAVRCLSSDAGSAAIGQAVEATGRRGWAISDREREVLRLTADGLSAAEIGAAIHLSPTTVKSHLHSAYEKLGVSDRAAAVALAIRSGLLD